MKNRCRTEAAAGWRSEPNSTAFTLKLPGRIKEGPGDTVVVAVRKAAGSCRWLEHDFRFANLSGSLGLSSQFAFVSSLRHSHHGSTGSGNPTPLATELR